jgi:hypothetical protein
MPVYQSINLSIYQPINLHPSGFIRIVLSICVVRFLSVNVCICAWLKLLAKPVFAQGSQLGPYGK